MKGGKDIIRRSNVSVQAVAKTKMVRQVKTIQQAPTSRAQGKENKEARSLVPVRSGEVSDSEDDNHARRKGRKTAAKELQFGHSPAKRNALGVRTK